MEEIIKLKNISKIYSHRGTFKTACDNISFTVKEGESTSLLGLNGAGKSTLIQILCTSLVPTSGEGYVCGFNLTENLKIKQVIGVLHEMNPLYEKMKVFEFLRFYQNMYDLDDVSYIDNICETFSLAEQKDKLIKNLSKGFKQRVGLASSIVHKPKLVILDEPTSGLDAKQQSEFEKLILALQKDITILLCTHDLGFASKTCKNHILLNNGKIFASGNLQKIKEILNLENASDFSKSILETAFEKLNLSITE